ncbi:hypothetical protein FOA52_007227 [Chlamydomonas sp. UWO 241]|nr:hypothetical protein FOA52_007227 [Chlamydomonas sp. UWO 241]
MADAEAVPGASTLGGFKVVLQRIQRALEECVELLPPGSGKSENPMRIGFQVAMQGLAEEMRRGDMSFEHFVSGMQWAGVALEKLAAFSFSPEAAGSHGRMGALRERTIISEVMPDLATAFADMWSITSADNLTALSEGAGYIISVLSTAANYLKSDLEHVFTPSAIGAVLMLSKGLWQLELQGHTHQLVPTSGGGDTWCWRRELARFLVDSGEPTIAVPKLRGAPPHTVSRTVYNGAEELFNALLVITSNDDVAPEELPLLQALLATLRTQLVYRVSWGMWGERQWAASEGDSVPGTQLQDTDEEHHLARMADYNADTVMPTLLGLLRTVLPKLRGGDAGVLAAVVHDAQSADRSRAALELLRAIASLGAVALDSNIDAVKMVMSLQPGVWQAAIDSAKTAACKCTPTAASIICTTATASKLLAQLCMPPEERPAQMLPRLLARVTHEMTIVCSAIAVTVAKPEQQVQQGQQRPSRHLLTVVFDDDGSSCAFGSRPSSLSPMQSPSFGTSFPGGTSGECSGGGALASAETLASLNDHSLGAGPAQPPASPGGHILGAGSAQPPASSEGHILGAGPAQPPASAEGNRHGAGSAQPPTSSEGHSLGAVPAQALASSEGHSLGAVPAQALASSEGHSLGAVPAQALASSEGHSLGAVPAQALASSEDHSLGAGPVQPRASPEGHSPGAGPAQPPASPEGSSVGAGPAQPPTSSEGHILGVGSAQPPASSDGHNLGAGPAQPPASPEGHSLDTGPAQPPVSSEDHSLGAGPVQPPASPDGHSLGAGSAQPPASSDGHSQPHQLQRYQAAAQLQVLQSRLLESLDAAAKRGEFAVVEAIDAVRMASAGSTDPMQCVRTVGAATLDGMGIARYHPPRRVDMGAGMGASQQQPTLAADDAPPGVIVTLERANRECRDLLRAVAKVLLDARQALLLLQSSEGAGEAHSDSGSSEETDMVSCSATAMEELLLRITAASTEDSDGGCATETVLIRCSSTGTEDLPLRTTAAAAAAVHGDGGSAASTEELTQLSQQSAQLCATAAAAIRGRGGFGAR